MVGDCGTFEVFAGGGFEVVLDLDRVDFGDEADGSTRVMVLLAAIAATPALKVLCALRRDAATRRVSISLLTIE